MYLRLAALAFALASVGVPATARLTHGLEALVLQEDEGATADGSMSYNSMSVAATQEFLMVGKSGKAGNGSAKAGKAGGKSVKAPSARERIQQCKAGLEEGSTTHDVSAYVGHILDLQSVQFAAPDWVIPLDPGNTPFAVLANRLLSDLTFAPIVPGVSELAALGLSEGFQWFSPTLPSSYDATRQCPALPDGAWQANTCDLPPSFDDLTSFFKMVPPFFHEVADVPTWGLKKSGIIPICVAAWTGLDPSDFDSPTFSTLFTTNLEDRGVDNELKRQYMSALTCDKLGNYEPIISGAFDRLLNELQAPDTPVLSTWGDIVSDIFLDLHFGKVDHPDYVRSHFRKVLRFIADLGRGKFEGNQCEDFATLGEAACEVQEVLKYVVDRTDAVVDQEDKATFTFWWVKAGLPEEKVHQEVLHNALAFNQWISSVYLTVAAKIYGRLSATSLAEGSKLGPPIDFFQKYEEASNAAERLDVIREVWRLLMPNNLWTSRNEDAGNVINKDKSITDYTEDDFKGTGHIPFIMQAINDGFNPDPSTGFSTTAYTYGTDRYDDFRIDSGAASGNALSCPFIQGKGPFPPNEESILGPEDFAPSSVDGETMIPEGHEKLFPVFENPKYLPFGLGYRRCPAELLNNMFMDILLSKIGGLDFEFVGGPPSLLELIRGKVCDDNDDTVVPGGIVCRDDNLRVKF